MRTITKYCAYDGTEFLTPQACEEYEHKGTLLKEALRPLGDQPNFRSSREGWVQHSPYNHLRAKRDVMLLSLHVFDCFPDVKAYVQADPDGVSLMSIASRIIDECGDAALRMAWWRLSVIDRHHREFSQSYYVINGPDAGMTCVEDRSDFVP